MFDIPAIRATGSLLAGVVIGAFFFGGLWWTVQRLPNSRHPAAMFLFSFVVRTAVTLTGFRLVMASQWEPAIWCLLGFLIARTMIRRRIRPPAAVRAESADSVSSAEPWTGTSQLSLPQVGSLSQTESARRQTVP